MVTVFRANNVHPACFGRKYSGTKYNIVGTGVCGKHCLKFYSVLKENTPVYFVKLVHCGGIMGETAAIFLAECGIQFAI